MSLVSKVPRRLAAPTVFPTTGVLAVIHPRVPGRGTLAAYAHEMVAAQLALAARDSPPDAAHLALLQTFQRGAKVR